jgi:hypothetical protein
VIARPQMSGVTKMFACRTVLARPSCSRRSPARSHVDIDIVLEILIKDSP